MVENNSSQLLDLFYDKLRLSYPISFLSDEKLSEIILACKDQDELQVISYYLGLLQKSSPNLKDSGMILFKNVDDSTYNLGQWIRAISYFHHWLNERNRSSEFSMMLGYIQCATGSPENKTLKFELVDILEHMLDEHGYNG